MSSFCIVRIVNCHFNRPRRPESFYDRNRLKRVLKLALQAMGMVLSQLVLKETVLRRTFSSAKRQSTGSE
jgi:hypothetical protein